MGRGEPLQGARHNKPVQMQSIAASAADPGPAAWSATGLLATLHNPDTLNNCHGTREAHAYMLHHVTGSCLLDEDQD